MTQPGIGGRCRRARQGHFQVFGGVAADQSDRIEELAGLLNIDVKNQPCRLRLQGHHRESVPHDVVHIPAEALALLQHRQGSLGVLRTPFGFEALSDVACDPHQPA